MDRLRSLPISRFSIIDAGVWANTALTTLSLAVTTAIGFAIGFRLHVGVGSPLDAFGMCVVFGFAFCWLFVALGLFAGSPQAAQSLSFLVFPLTFVSSAYVPVSTMPGWMQAFANHQPITAMVNTVRILTEGHAAEAVLGHPLHALPPGVAGVVRPHRRHRRAARRPPAASVIDGVNDGAVMTVAAQRPGSTAQNTG